MTMANYKKSEVQEREEEQVSAECPRVRLGDDGSWPILSDMAPNEQVARAWAEEQVRNVLGAPRLRRSTGSILTYHAYVLIAILGFGLVALGFAIPMMTQTIRYFSTPAFITGGFMIGYATNWLRR